MKKLILFLAACCWLLAPGSFAQEIEWENTIGGSGGDLFYSIQQTSDGGYILGGWSGSNISGDKTENCIGANDYWILKTDASGNIQWQNTIGGSDFDDLWSIQQTSDGGYILGGFSSSNISGDKTENNIGFSVTNDYWIVKTDATGAIQWQNTIGGSDNEQLYSIQQTADGGYILGGWSTSNISGDKTENCIGGSFQGDYWIVKTDASGNIQWQNTIGGTGDDALWSIRQTADGGYILGGRSNSNISGDKTENCNGYDDYWIVKTDATGNIQWENTIGGGSSEVLFSIQQTADGGYILGGYSASNISVDKTENSMGGNDYWMVKTDATGNIQWQNTIGGSGNEVLFSIQQTADGGYFLGGWSTSSISGDKTENNWDIICNPVCTTDYWIVKTDASGNIQWQNTIGGNSGEYLYSIQQSAIGGGYILGGWSDSNISGDKTENNMGIDYWIVKVTDKFNSITGKLFIDSNSNGLQDAGEPPVNHHGVYELNTGRFAFTNDSGDYQINVLDTGDFQVASLLNYYNSVPVNHFINFPAFYLTDSLNDFAYQSAGVFNDLCAYLTPMGMFRAGFDANYMITYQNVGTTTLNGTVIFFPDTNLTFVSSNVIPTSVTTDSIVWNVGTLTPFQIGNILVTVHVDAGTPIGTLINSTVRIEPFAGDANTDCNFSEWGIFVTGSYDPNVMLVDRDTILTTELTNPPYLDYIIYFQNTGNDTAFNAKALNPVDTFKLQLNTFEFVASSHPMNITYKPWERNFEFTFDNILLPDSNVNEPASHGFVRYRIKPKTTLIAGDEIQNTAYIYFDFNAPVQTNTAVTEVVLPTSIGGFNVQSLKFNVFPNPAGGELIVNCYSLIGNEKMEVKIYDLFGREVFSKYQVSSIKTKEIKLDISKFAEGIYVVELSSGENVYRGKFVKD